MKKQTSKKQYEEYKNEKAMAVDAGLEAFSQAEKALKKQLMELKEKKQLFEQHIKNCHTTKACDLLEREIHNFDNPRQSAFVAAESRMSKLIKKYENFVF